MKEVVAVSPNQLPCEFVILKKEKKIFVEATRDFEKTKDYKVFMFEDVFTKLIDEEQLFEKKGVYYTSKPFGWSK